MKLIEPIEPDFDPFDTLCRVAMQGQNNAKHSMHTSETIAKLTHLIQLQSTRIDLLERQVDRLIAQIKKE